MLISTRQIKLLSIGISSVFKDSWNDHQCS